MTWAVNPLVFSSDATEDPTELTALTYTYIKSPYTRLRIDVMSLIGTEQLQVVSGFTEGVQFDKVTQVESLFKNLTV